MVQAMRNLRGVIMLAFGHGGVIPQDIVEAN